MADIHVGSQSETRSDLSRWKLRRSDSIGPARLSCGLIRQGIHSSSRIGFEDSANFITDAEKNRPCFFRCASGFGGIFKSPMVAVHQTGKKRADPVGIATDCDNRLDLLIEELIEVFGSMAADVDANFCHDADGKWMYVADRLGSGAYDKKPITQGCLQDALGDMGAAGVA